MVDMPSKIALEKYDYMFASMYQLEKVYWLQAEPCIHFPLTVLGPYLTLTLCTSSIFVNSYLY